MRKVATSAQFRRAYKRVRNNAAAVVRLVRVVDALCSFGTVRGTKERTKRKETRDMKKIDGESETPAAARQGDTAIF